MIGVVTEKCRGCRACEKVCPMGAIKIVEKKAVISEECVNCKSCLKECKFDALREQERPDPDFVIRTSGEQRISNLLLYQIAYAELYFTDVAWPDFDEKEYLAALQQFAGRNRRFGDIK